MLRQRDRDGLQMPVSAQATAAARDAEAIWRELHDGLLGFIERRVRLARNRRGHPAGGPSVVTARIARFTLEAVRAPDRPPGRGIAPCCVLEAARASRSRLRRDVLEAVDPVGDRF